MIGHSYINNAEFWIGWKEGPKFGTVGVKGGSVKENSMCIVPGGPSNIIRLDMPNKIVYFSLLFRFYKDLLKDLFPDGYYFSKGSMAALIAMDYLMPNQLFLIGCDNLKNGEVGNYKSHRYDFGTGRSIYSEVESMHSYQLEHELIDKVKDNYPVEVVYV